MLLRYILAIGYDTAKYAQVEEVNCRVQENVIRTFLQSDIPNIIFDVICTNREREFSLHFLSIFALVVKPFVSLALYFLKARFCFRMAPRLLLLAKKQKRISKRRKKKRDDCALPVVWVI